jgi:hypothetical protein
MGCSQAHGHLAGNHPRKPPRIWHSGWACATVTPTLFHCILHIKLTAAEWVSGSVWLSYLPVHRSAKYMIMVPSQGLAMVSLGLSWSSSTMCPLGEYPVQHSATFRNGASPVFRSCTATCAHQNLIYLSGIFKFYDDLIC